MRHAAPDAGDVRRRVWGEVREIVRFVEHAGGAQSYEDFEGELIGRVFRLARLLIVLFLALCEGRAEVPASFRRGRRQYRRQPAKGRWLGTLFGEVRYWRTYAHQTNGRGGGFYPLDDDIGLTADGFSFGLLGRAVLLATKMSFAAAAMTLTSFLGWSPSTKTIERAALGLGRQLSFAARATPPSSTVRNHCFDRMASAASNAVLAASASKTRSLMGALLDGHPALWRQPLQGEAAGCDGDERALDLGRRAGLDPPGGRTA